MKHLDLFSGIGGFALAAQNVWDNHEVIAFVDNDEFCQQVLKKHWPEVPIFGDIKQFSITNTEYGGWNSGSTQDTGKQYDSDKQKEGGELRSQDSRRDRQPQSIDLITGGFPCQPFSQAGKRKGTEDDRDLWPEMFRLVREVAPRWVVGENVRGLTNWNDGVVFDKIYADLESAGYEVTSFILPAVAVNAPHRRDRVWIVAHNASGSNGGHNREPQKGQEQKSGKSYGRGDAPNADTGRIRRYKREGTEKRTTPRSSWEENWLEVATELCGVDDGLPARVDGFELTKSQHRRERLKALGNAIVPQVAEQIFRSIKEEESLL